VGRSAESAHFKTGDDVSVAAFETSGGDQFLVCAKDAAALSSALVALGLSALVALVALGFAIYNLFQLGGFGS